MRTSREQAMVEVITQQILVHAAGVLLAAGQTPSGVEAGCRSVAETYVDGLAGRIVSGKLSEEDLADATE